MFAPKPFDVAKGNGARDATGRSHCDGQLDPQRSDARGADFEDQLPFTPPPPEGFVSPMTWGVESNVIDRFTAAGIPRDNISFARDRFTFNFPGTPSTVGG